MGNENEYVPGLEGIVAAETRLSEVKGLEGKLTIAGFPVEELAANATHEEAIALLWFDRLPDRGRLDALRDALRKNRRLSEATRAVLEAAAREGVSVMDALRMGTATITPPAVECQGIDIDPMALSIVAKLPVITATFWRLRQQQTPVEPDDTLDQAANYLYMLTGRRPSPARVRGLETYLNTVIDHGLNASTFTARVIVSTGSDLVSAVTGAIGALKGPLHGGAPGPALEMVFEIGKKENAERYIRKKLEQGERLMGFGHRVYKVYDPRARVLSAAAERMFAREEDLSLYELARHVERVALDLLAEYKPGRNLQTNVEFYTALLLHGLELEVELFTPTFALSRAAGWIAHALEQRERGRLIRPKARYIGDHDRRWIPLDERSAR